MAEKRGISKFTKGMQRTENEELTRVSLGEGVLIDGVDQEAARRAHMRELTMARQAAERARGRTGNAPPESSAEERRAAQKSRATAADVTLAEIEATHQAWLNDQESTTAEG